MYVKNMWMEFKCKMKEGNQRRFTFLAHLVGKPWHRVMRQMNKK